jgi:phospholipase A1
MSVLGRLLPVLLLGALLCGAGPAFAYDSIETCVQDALLAADNATTVGQLRENCRKILAPPIDNAPVGASGQAALPDVSMVERRAAVEKHTADLPYTLTPHRLNYLLPWVYNRHPNGEVFRDGEFAGGGAGGLDRVEVKFQLSLKYKLADNILGRNADFYVGYTNLSYWQAYNSRLSSPFRDTNHEPEAWLQFATDWRLGGGVRARVVQVGVWHHSNGRGEPLSRSWNRLYANLVLERGRLLVALKPWYRFPEKAEDDNNPDIDRFYGYGELDAVYRLGKQQHLAVTWRNNLRRENKGAVQVGWTFPLRKKLVGYVQYFNGYGQTLIDYNHSASTLGVGIALSDIL